jgi:hypothetical protein
MDCVIEQKQQKAPPTSHRNEREQLQESTAPRRAETCQQNPGRAPKRKQQGKLCEAPSSPNRQYAP